MNRLYPLMWVEVLNGGRLDLTDLARAFHSSCSSWLRFLHSLSPRWWMEIWTCWPAVPGNVGLALVLK